MQKLMPVESVEHGTELDSMGPYESGCFITTDLGASQSASNVFTGGNEGAGTTTTIKILTPDTDFGLNFEAGSKLYS